MAINKIGVLQPTTPATDDWNNLIGHINAYSKQLSGLQYPLSGTVLKQSSYIQHGGVLYQVQDSDYTILGSIVAGVFNYIKITVSGENLVATWVTDISAYTWSNEYNYLVAVDESQIIAFTEKDGIVYRLEQKNEIYKSNQDLNTTNDVEFNRVNTGNGLTKIFDMDQNLKTTDNPTYAGLSLNGAFLPTTAPTSGTQTILKSNGTWVPPRGIYIGSFAPTSGTTAYMLLSVDGGVTYSVYYASPSIATIIADGSKIVLKNTNSPYDIVFTYLKF